MSSQPNTAPMQEAQDLREFTRQAMVSGAAVTLPFLVTLMVLGFVIDFVSRQLNPVVGVFASVTGLGTASDLLVKLIVLLTLLALMFLVGVITQRQPEESDLGAFFDALISRIPGIGSLYRSLDEMSGLLLDSDTDSFQEVKLVEFPGEGSYAVAFLTADTPEVVETATGTERMYTLFLPMAPNPVMGGHVVHVTADRVVDVDLTVEEGIQSIVTSGVATGKNGQDDLSEDALERLNRRLADSEVVASLEEYAADASTRFEETASERLGPDDAEGPSSNDETGSRR